MKKFINKWSKFAVLILAAVAAALFLVVRAHQPLPAPPPLPNPNGYDDFWKAGQLVQDLIPSGVSFRDLEADTLRAIVKTNAEALRLVRLGLTRETRNRSVFDTNYIPSRLNMILATKRLATVMACEGKLFEFEKQTNRAAMVYLETMKYGHESLRGGVLIDRLVGSACEGIGIYALRPIVCNLDAQTSRAITRAMELLETLREPLDEVLANEREWARQNRNWREFIEEVYREKTLTPDQAARDSFVKEISKRTLNARQLMIELAAQAYELEKGRRPKSVSALVPDYLRAVPIDPATGTNLVYRP